MTFNPTIPKATDLLANSQVDLLANNVALNSIFSRNHVALNVATNSGKHPFVEMPNLSAIPSPPGGLTNGEGTIYTKASGGSQLFYVPGTTGNEYQLTNTNSGNFATFGGATNGWTFLPGGLVMNYGNISESNSSTRNVSYSRNFSSAVYQIVVTPYRESSSPGGSFGFWVINSSFGLSGFQIKNDGGHTFGYMWIAIGK